MQHEGFVVNQKLNARGFLRIIEGFAGIDAVRNFGVI
jgi:hypothetical protein